MMQRRLLPAEGLRFGGCACAEEGEAAALDSSSNPVVTVYVGNLPPTVDEVALMLPFSYFGSITNIQVSLRWLHLKRPIVTMR